MSAHSYTLRSRLSTASSSVKVSTNSPLSKTGSRSPRKQQNYISGLQLKHVIGTTSATPSGLASCELTNSFAYCAGSVAVLAEISPDNTIAYRYYKAHPTALAYSSKATYGESNSNSNTPTRRSSAFPGRRGGDGGQNNGYTREWIEESAAQTWSARERIKAATCVSISPDGRLLAVGETGYNPRVLLFSTSASASVDIPIAIVTEHSVGVRAVAFSPDSKYLATLGDINDGFLHIWTVSPRTGDVRLQSSNKCTTNICAMTWCGNALVTVGTRHVKIWQVSTTPRTSPQKKPRLRGEGEQISSPGPTPLPGRNCLLGKMVDSTFTSVAAISPTKAIVCTDDGYMCTLDISAGNASLNPVRTVESSVTAITYWQNGRKATWVAADQLQQDDVSTNTEDDGQKPHRNSLPAKIKAFPLRRSLLRESLGLSPSRAADAIAIACTARHAMCIGAGGYIRLIRLEEPVAELDGRKLSSHSQIIKGIRKFPVTCNLGAFFTWAKDGEIRFWSSGGHLLYIRSIHLEQVSDAEEPECNELGVVCFAAARDKFAVGDKFGVLQVMDQSPWRASQVIRAHSAEITDLAFHEQSSLLATCGRDRMVQIFDWNQGGLELLQTVDDHISVVNAVIFNRDGSRLLSCSADRTVIVRDCILREDNGQLVKAFLSNRIITLKGSPLSMTLQPENQEVLFVSTMDKFVMKIEVGSGSVMDVFKVADTETDDTTTLSTICLSSSQCSNDPPILAGCSPIDKSIRVYDVQRGVLLGREWGHTEGVSDMILLEEDSENGMESNSRTIVSAGSDNTIMMWCIQASTQLPLTPLQELSQSQVELGYDSESTPQKASPATLPPLRKILTKSDAAGFSRQNSPTREVSPHRLRRKTSRLALSTSIDDVEENSYKEAFQARRQEVRAVADDRSPSPSNIAIMKSKRQRSRPEVIKSGEGGEYDGRAQSSSPPPLPCSMPGPSTPSVANKGRLRRPPSIPADLRSSISTPTRRQSMSVSSEGGSIGAASEVVCRMLKTYRKKLRSTKDNTGLDSLEIELEMILGTIRERKNKTTDTNIAVGSPTADEKVNAIDDIDGVTAMLAKTHMSKD